jgi:DNA-binding NarL/FixJ family response regulator
MHRMPTLLRTAPPAEPAGAAIDATEAGALLDGLAHGIVLVDVEARAGFANAEARRQLRAGTAGLRIEDGVLRTVDARHEPAWREALRAAGMGRPSALRGLSAGDAGALSLAPGLHAGTVVCAMPPDGLRSVQAYARLHRLTAAEADVLLGLVRGEAPKSVARRRRTAEGTVRSQVKSLLGKTGRGAIRELVADVLRCPPHWCGPCEGLAR